MSKLKSSKGRIMIDFGEMKEPKGGKVPASLADNEIFTYNLSMLDQFDPDKLLYSVKEASIILSVSDDFVGRRVRSGKIKAAKFGDRHMISKLILAQIMTEGAK